MEISAEDFRRQVMRDYQCARAGLRVQYLAAERQLADALVSDCNVAQVVMAKCVTKADELVFQRRQVAFEFAMGDGDAADTEGKLRDLAPKAQGSRVDYVRALSTDAGSDRISLCCIDSRSAVEGAFFEALYNAVERQSATAIVVWNNDGRHSNASLQRLFGGFAAFEHTERPLSILTASEGDYVSLCQTIQHQIDTTRRHRQPSLTIIETSADGLALFAKWLTDRGICSSADLSVLTP